jgi:hypothetical protein
MMNSPFWKPRFIDMVDLHANYSGFATGLDNSEINYQLAGMRRLSQRNRPIENLPHLSKGFIPNLVH